LETLSEKSFLRRHLLRKIDSVFPSTTSAAITSISTASFPAQHGILGWTLTEIDQNGASLRFNPLPFTQEDRSSDDIPMPLPSSVFKTQSIWPNLDVQTASFTAYQHGAYSEHHMNTHVREHCSSFVESTDSVIKFITECHAKRAFEKTESIHSDFPDALCFTYLYSSEPDSTEHSLGWDSGKARMCIQELDKQVERFWKSIETADQLSNTPVTLIISADHGHVSIRDPAKCIYIEENPFADLLRTQVTVEPRSPHFFVKETMHKEFIESWYSSTKLSSKFALLSMKDAEALQLYGPLKLSEHAQKYAGDYVAITNRDYIVLDESRKGFPKMIGWHGGLKPAEVEVPLIVAQKSARNHHSNKQIKTKKVFEWMRSWKQDLPQKEQ